MKFSIVTATYNSEATVADTVRSVAAQHGVDVEHIIIDNESDDATIGKIEACGSPFVKIFRGHDQGIYDAFNKGLAQCQSDVVAFLNSDDYYLEDTLAAVEKVFQDHPETGCVHGNIIVNGREFKPRNGVLSFGGRRIYHPASFMKRDLILKAGGFDSSFKIVADLNLFLRVSKDCRFVHLDRALTVFALGGMSTKNVFLNCTEVRRVLLMNGYGKLSANFLYCLEAGLSLPGHFKRMIKGNPAAHR